jgi:outer membrane murein-binding lipoprotein Lpp
VTDDRLFTLALIAIAVGLFLLPSGEETASDARIAQLEATVEDLQAQVDNARRASDRAAQTVQVKRNAIRTPDFRLSVDSAMALAVDTSATIKDLRVALVKTVEEAEAYQRQVLRYQESVDSLLIAHVQERQAVTVQVDTLTALAQARGSMRCAIWGVPCPNRTTAFLLGVGSALLLAVAVAF